MLPINPMQHFQSFDGLTLAYEVEFCDHNGKAYAMVALKTEQLMRLHHSPSHQAA